MKHKVTKNALSKKGFKVACLDRKSDKDGIGRVFSGMKSVTTRRKPKAISRKRAVVAISSTSPVERHRSILSGFQVEDIQPVASRLGIAVEDLAGRVGLSRSTYHRKVQAGGTLDALGSDALAKYQVLIAKAVEAFDGDEDAARKWLKAEQQGLGNQVPLDLARTTVGAREVEKLLTRIDYGVYA